MRTVLFCGSKKTKIQIRALITGVILSKLRNYRAETNYSPFFRAIFSQEQVLTHSIVHSFYTSFGTSMYEQIAVLLAKSAGFTAERQYSLLGTIDKKTEVLIGKIDLSLRAKMRKPDAIKELEEIRNIIQDGK